MKMKGFIYAIFLSFLSSSCFLLRSSHSFFLVTASSSSPEEKGKDKDGDRIPTLLSNEVIISPNGCGVLKPLQNAHLLQLKSCSSGGVYGRGYAHGYLLGTQIIDWSYFYQFKFNMNGNVSYYNEFRQWYQENQFIPSEYREEAEGVIQGMKDSNISLNFPELNRDYDIDDLYILNGYLEATIDGGAITQGPFTAGKKKFRIIPPQSPKNSNTNSNMIKHSRMYSPACTQFVAWDEMTSDGHTLAGRNMDGETDPWFVTVTHLIVFAIEPMSPDELKVVSVMWPGHIGTLSAMNEDGVSLMLNCGTMGDGPISTNITSIEWIMKSIITKARKETTTPKLVNEELNKFRSSEGGVSGAGSVLVFSKPNEAHGIYSDDTVPGFIAELDRYGTVVRTPQSTAEFQGVGRMSAIMQSNHFIEYGVNKEFEEDIGNPEYNFGTVVGFSSRWRYEAIKAAIESRNRTIGGGHLRKNQIDGLLGDNGANSILKVVSRGYTEHSIVFAPRPSATASRSKGPVFALANSNPFDNFGRWDAPYQHWIEYDFDELFAH